MKEYTTQVGNIPKIRQLFNGYIFRRIEDEIGHVKCTEKDANRIRRQGIELTEKETTHA